MPQLQKQYDSKEAEARWQKQWETSGVYHFRNDKPREQTFVVDTPPPTVSGILHMGHIYSYTQADFVARYQRMSGRDVFYPMGFDDNGLPTERLVEKTRNVRGSTMARAEFVALCREVVKEAEDEFRRLFKSTALSVDWNQEYQTISDSTRRISQASFLDLALKNEAYRKLQPMLWDPMDQTAIAQAEIVDKEMPSHMNDILFGLETLPTASPNENAVAFSGGNNTPQAGGGSPEPRLNENAVAFSGGNNTPQAGGGSPEPRLNENAVAFSGGNNIIIATTRPELLAACVAVFYHPDDERYQHLKGKTAVTPLFGVRVPILADEAVKMDKGTGLVMCCTFGDETDIHWWQTHNLPTRVVLNKYGKLDFAAFPEPESIQDKAQLEHVKSVLTAKKASDARTLTLELMQQQGLLVKQVAITHAVKCAERSGAPLEILPTYQWFVRVLDKKEQLKAKSAECVWHPPYMQVRMDQWIDGLSWDWCISRQRFFGVPFPVWYSKRPGEEGKILFASFEQLPVDPTVDTPMGYSADEVEADLDVMDTWATSSISPQINSRGISEQYCEDEQRHAKLFPADIRPQAHEIIRTWAFYTVAKALLHQGSIPWKHLMISGWCLASDKTKMSKSKGNVVTPVALIEEKGADAVRYWASTSRLGADTAFSEDVLKIGRKLVTKLWNASNFVAIQLEKLAEAPGATAAKDAQYGRIRETLDLWVLTRLSKAVEKATREFEQFEYCDARIAIEDFFWNDFCDNYLELVKARAYGENVSNEGQLSALLTLHHCLEAVLRLFAPFIPHVTEEIYSQLFPAHFQTHGSIHARGTWPEANAYPRHGDAEEAGIACLLVLEAIRRTKSEANVSIKYPAGVVRVASSEALPTLLSSTFADLAGAGSAESVEMAKGTFPIAATDGKMTLDIPLLPNAEASNA